MRNASHREPFTSPRERVECGAPRTGIPDQGKLRLYRAFPRRVDSRCRRSPTIQFRLDLIHSIAVLLR